MQDTCSKRRGLRICRLLMRPSRRIHIYPLTYINSCTCSIGSNTCSLASDWRLKLCADPWLLMFVTVRNACKLRPPIKPPIRCPRREPLLADRVRVKACGVLRATAKLKHAIERRGLLSGPLRKQLESRASL